MRPCVVASTPGALPWFAGVSARSAAVAARFVDGGPAADGAGPDTTVLLHDRPGNSLALPPRDLYNQLAWF